MKVVFNKARRRRVVVLGGNLARKLFSGRPALAETIEINSARFAVIGVMNKKLSFSNYFGPDDDSAFIPYSAAGDLWHARYASTLVFAPVSAGLEKKAIQQVRGILARRQDFSPTDERAVRMFGREEFRPVIDTPVRSGRSTGRGTRASSATSRSRSSRPGSSATKSGCGA